MNINNLASTQNSQITDPLSTVNSIDPTNPGTMLQTQRAVQNFANEISFVSAYEKLKKDLAQSIISKIA